MTISATTSASMYRTDGSQPLVPGEPTGEVRGCMKSFPRLEYVLKAMSSPLQVDQGRIDRASGVNFFLEQLHGARQVGAAGSSVELPGKGGGVGRVQPALPVKRSRRVEPRERVDPDRAGNPAVVLVEVLSPLEDKIRSGVRGTCRVGEGAHVPLVELPLHIRARVVLAVQVGVPQDEKGEADGIPGQGGKQEVVRTRRVQRVGLV